MPLLRAELQANDGCWLLNQKRQQTIKVQKNTQSIFLRSAASPADPQGRLEDVHASCDTQLALLFPQTMRFLRETARSASAELCRALYVRLKPKSIVFRHIDNGEYYKPRQRHHLVIESPCGSPMQAGDEQVVMGEGELWWFDNKAPHASGNSSDEWRTHLIFDLLMPPPNEHDTRIHRPAAVEQLTPAHA